MNINNIEEFKSIIANEPYHQKPILPFDINDDIHKLNKIFNNKRVAIVGPASELQTQNLGSLIDSYDIVCKVGGMYKIKDDLNYGSRIDYLFHGFFPNHYKIEEYENEDIKNFICPIKSCIPGITDVHNRDIYKYYNDAKNYYHNRNFYNISLFSCHIDNTINTRCTLGSFSILFLIEQNLKELGIFGFTWLFSHKQYNTKYHNFGRRLINPHGTDMKIEAKYIKNKIIEKQNKFNINLSDEVLYTLNNIID